jgi:AraC family transcriptional regulator
MTAMRIVIAILGITCAVFLLMCWAAGVFDTVNMKVAEQGPYSLVFREHKGPYRGIKYALYDVFRYLSDKRSIAPKLGFAIFYDNPQKVKPDSLRSIAGYITDSILPGVTEPYKTDVFAKTRAITGVFPIRTFISQFTGPLKFYPRLLLYLKQEKLEAAGPVMEIYNIAGKKIVYIAPVK